MANEYGNYAVWDVLQPASRVGTGTYTNGNLSVVTGSSPDFAVANLQIPTTGKWYFECELTANDSSTRNIGLCDASGSPDGTMVLCTLVRTAHTWTQAIQLAGQVKLEQPILIY